MTDHVTQVSEVKGIPSTAWCLTSKAITSLETPLGEPGANNPLEDDYSKDSQRIAKWLTTLRRPEGLSRTEFRAFKQKASQFSVMDRRLWKNATKAFPPRMVIDSDSRRAEIMHELHDLTGHRGRESTYARIVA